jgi:magnesium-transporting ATPase (P-type)
MTNWHELDQNTILAELGSDLENGLSSQEAELKLQQHGPNELTERAYPGLENPAHQFTGIMIII